MRRPLHLLVGLLLLSVASCDDRALPTQSAPGATSERYLYSTTGTLGDEIVAMSLAIFPNGLETAAGTRWDQIRSRVASRDLVGARAKLVELASWIKQKTPQMDLPLSGESRDAAAARLVLYMSLYVYNGDGPVPSTLGTGADATVAIVSPETQTIMQTPLKHAGARFDIGTVSENTIVVISQNTQSYLRHCDGPFTTKYCQYPLFYHYQSFPAQRFLKPVHMAICHVTTANNYGVLAGVDHDQLVVAHDKPADPANYTPGGYPVAGENIEVLPGKLAYDPTAPLIACSGTAYQPQFTQLEHAPAAHGALGVLLAAATRGVNRFARAAGAALAPRSAYAIDLGWETNTLTFSNFANIDVLGHPDVSVANGSTAATATAGQSFNVTYTVANNGTAPSPVVAATFQLVQTAVEFAPLPIALTPTSLTAVGGTAGGALFPLENRSESATLALPANLASGNYTIRVTLASTGGVAELPITTGDNALALPVQISSATTVTVDGLWGPTEWDPNKCVALAVNVPEGGTTPGKFCWQNDATNMFFGVRIDRATDIAVSGFDIEFDRDNSGTITAGDDAIVANRQAGFFDDVRKPCVADPLSLCGPSDTSQPGGTNDGRQGWGFDGSHIVGEMSHPLNSGDANDVALTTNQSVGIRMSIRLIGTTLVDTYYPNGGYAPISFGSPNTIYARTGAAVALSRSAPTTPLRAGSMAPARRTLSPEGALRLP